MSIAINGWSKQPNKAKLNDDSPSPQRFPHSLPLPNSPSHRHPVTVRLPESAQRAQIALPKHRPPLVRRPPTTTAPIGAKKYQRDATASARSPRHHTNNIRPASANHPFSNLTSSQQNQPQPLDDASASAQLAPSGFPALEPNAASANNRMESATSTLCVLNEHSYITC